MIKIVIGDDGRVIRAYDETINVNGAVAIVSDEDWQKVCRYDDIRYSEDAGLYVTDNVINEDLGRKARGRRDALLSATDWTQLPDVSETVSGMWRVYRQALRDITAQTGFPRVIEWPEPPGEVK